MTDKTLGNYKIVDKLGEGGMGEVWRAKDERLNRTVAIKILPFDVSGDPSRRARFEQEGRALGALNHPNILSIYDVGEDNGRAYIVSELVDGDSLRTLMDRGRIPVRKAIDIGVQMAEGIAAAHSLGIVHRDLKPENVMVTRSGQAKLLDFGLAKQSAAAVGEGTQTMALSTPGVVMGTVGYMSPEQVRGEPLDGRSDIFSLGCILYEMLAGRRTFQSTSGIETMHAILHADPPDFDAALAMPAALATIVRRCLEKQPDQRFQSAADLAFALRSISGTTTISGVQAIVPHAAASKQKRWVWPLIASVCALALVAVGLFSSRFVNRRQPVTYQRITFRKGYILRARFTSDGRNVVYCARFENGPTRTYLAVPGNPDSRDLDLPNDAYIESVSSTQQLAFTQNDTLSVVSLSGGQPRALLEDVLAADWAPDGTSMAVLRSVNHVVRLEYPLGNVLLDRIVWAQSMVRVSPDGSKVVFATYGSGSSIQLKVVDRDKKVTALGMVSGQLTTGEDSSLVWSPKSDEIWFRSFDSADPGIVYAIDMKGRRRVALALPTRVKFYDLASDGQALLATGSAAIGILAAQPGDAAERDLSCLDSGVLRAISNDGQEVLANITGESGGAKGAAYVRKMDGSAPVRVADGHAFLFSPDAKWVSGYLPDDKGFKRFLLIPVGPGEAEETRAPGMAFTIVVGWLPGERNYLIQGAPKDGKGSQCFVWDAAHGTTRPVCPPSDLEPSMLLSPNRKVFLSRADNHKQFVIYSIDGGASRPASGLTEKDSVVGWRGDNQSVYVQPNGGTNVSIPVTIVDLESGTRTPWKTLRPAQPFLETYAPQIAPDGAYAYNFVLANSDLYMARGLR